MSDPSDLDLEGMDGGRLAAEAARAGADYARAANDRMDRIGIAMQALEAQVAGYDMALGALKRQLDEAAHSILVLQSRLAGAERAIEAGQSRGYGAQGGGGFSQGGGGGSAGGGQGSVASGSRGGPFG